MTSEEQFDRNRKYYIATQYLQRLLEAGVINRAQFLRGSRFFAEQFDVTMRVFV